MRIAVKYPLFLLFTTIVSCFALYFALLEILSSSIEEEITKRGETTVESFAMANAPAILKLPSESAKAELHFNLLAVARNADVLNARLADNGGKIIDSLLAEEIGQQLPDFFTGPNAPTTYADPQNHAYHFSARVRYGQVLLGTFVLTLSSLPLEQALAQAKTRATLFAVGIALAMSMFALLMVGREVRPLQQISAILKLISEGDFSQRIPEGRSDEIGDLARAFNHMVHRTQLFFHYVDKMVIERLAADESLTKPGGRETELSVVFGDMRGYTEMSNRRSANDVVKIVNTFFHLFIECVAHFDGVVDKTMGDAIMAVFQRLDDEEPEGHKRRSLLATSYMKACNRVLNLYLLEQSMAGETFDVEPREFGFAVATGTAIIGNIGSERRMDYTVCGRVVNLASRLEGLTKSGELIVDNFTRLGASDVAVTEQLPPVQPKGYSDKEKVIPHRVIDMHENEAQRLRAFLRKQFTYRFIESFLIPEHLPVGKHQPWCNKAEEVFRRLIDETDVSNFYAKANAETGLVRGMKSGIELEDEANFEADTRQVSKAAIEKALKA